MRQSGEVATQLEAAEGWDDGGLRWNVRRAASGVSQDRVTAMLIQVRAVLSSLLPYAIVVSVTFAALCAFLYFRQESFLFFPGPNDPGLRSALREQRIELMSGNTVLEGWWTENPAAPTSAVIVYFGGNAEDVLYFASTAAQLPARHVLVANYRGYGRNPGSLSEQVAYQDALALYDYAAQRSDVKADEIFVMGRSLGSGIATYVAAHRPVAGTILVTPYDSMVAVAGRHYPIFPVSWLLKHRFASDQLAPKIASPVLMLAAELDQVIPPTHAQRLFELWSGPKSIHVLRNAGHNDIESEPQYDALINAFLSERAAARN